MTHACQDSRVLVSVAYSHTHETTMPIRVSCPGCSKSFTAPESAAGKRGKCPKCGTRVEVPGDETDDYGLSDLPGAVPTIDAGDFDDAMRPSPTPLPTGPSPTRLADLYAPQPGPEKRRQQATRASARTRGRYERAMNLVISLDWINFLGVIIIAIVAAGYGAMLLAKGDATEREWAIFRLMWIAEFYVFWAYVGVFLSATAFLALLDIEDHLSSKAR